MAHDALSAHARDELGISESLSARPLQAALTSAITFAAGALLPLFVQRRPPPRERTATLRSRGSALVLPGRAGRRGGARGRRGAVEGRAAGRVLGRAGDGRLGAGGTAVRRRRLKFSWIASGRRRLRGAMLG